MNIAHMQFSQNKDNCTKWFSINSANIHHKYKIMNTIYQIEVVLFHSNSDTKIANSFSYCCDTVYIVPNPLTHTMPCIMLSKPTKSPTYLYKQFK